MEDEKTKEGSVTSPSFHPSKTSPKKVDVENVPQDGNDETTTILETKSPKKVDIEKAHQDGNDETTQTSKTISAQKVDIQAQESAGGNPSSPVAAQPEPHKKRLLMVSYSSPLMKMKDAANAEKEQTYSSSPIAPVKHTVSRFGGIVDWKAHKQHTLERRKFIQLELEKANEEIPVFGKQCEAAEEEKQQILKKVSSTKRVNEDLKLNLERAHIEEYQARQDADLAMLRLEELEKGIADEASVAYKVQLEVALARYDEAVYDLKKVQKELEQIQQEFTLLSAEKESAVTKAKESIATSKKVEKSLEDSSIELINTKDELESAQAAHLEAEEQRAEELPVLEQDVLRFENELREAEEELEKINQKFSSAKNVEAELVTSLELLQKLKGELNVYMETNLKKKKDENEEKNRGEIEAAVKSARMELQETQANISKAIDEIKTFKKSASSLNAELETQKAEISKMVKLPARQEASHETNQAKSLVELRREEYRKAKEEVRQANNEKNMVENKFLTAQKEIELAKVAEKLGLDSINEQEESEPSETINEENSQTKVTLTLEEYYEHNIQALQAEDDANKKVLIALSEIDAAKESELDSIDKLNEINNDISHIKEQLEIALQKVKITKEGKLHAEEELRKWRDKQQQILKEAEERKQAENKKTLHSSNSKSSGATKSGPEGKPKKKRRLSIPRFFMFMGRKKSSSKPPT